MWQGLLLKIPGIVKWVPLGASHMNQALPTRHFTLLGIISLVQKYTDYKE
jgi:hypothetical protein